MSALRKNRGSLFYETALNYAQTLWLAGFPAQALLQINRSMAADLDGNEEISQRWPIGYAAAAWIIHMRPEGQFLGNPRRHYQHLASRMVEPRKNLRSWRAWACWAIAGALLPSEDFPADNDQIERENLVEPTHGCIAAGLHEFGWPGEALVWQASLPDAKDPNAAA